MIIGPKSIGKKSFQLNGTTLIKYHSSKTNATCIPFGVTEIGEKSFENCTNLITILIPETVEKIGHQAFQGCDNLKYINIPSSVKKMGEFVFDGCAKLRRLYIPDSVQECHLLGRLRLDYLRIPLKLWNRGIFSGGIAPELRVAHLAMGLPNKYKPIDGSFEINDQLFKRNEACPNISFEVPSSGYSSDIVGTEYGCINGCVVDYSFIDEFEGRVISIPDDCLAVPSEFQVLDWQCVGESRKQPLYIPETVEYIDPDAFELWSKPKLVTPESNYKHLVGILPSSLTAPGSMSDVTIYVI